MLRYCKKAIHSFIDANQFYPSIFGILVNPFWLCRRALYKKLCEYAPLLVGVVLDFGCGTGTYRDLLTSATKYIGLEYDSPDNRRCKQADLYYDGNIIPLEDGSMDNVLSTQTIEHIPNPERIGAEWRRILRPGGKVLLTVPFMWPEHEMPYDFQRYTTNGLRNLLERNGFEIISQDRLLCDCRAPAQIFLAWLYDILHLGARKPIINLILTACLFAPISLAATLLAVITTQQNTYLDNIILAKRI